MLKREHKGATAKPRLNRCLWSLALAGLTLLLLSASARAAGPFELPSVLAIAKSSNRNQVNYAVEVDEACTPTGNPPVRAYWRMVERGPLATEPLSEREQRVLGIDRQGIAGNRVQFALRGMRDRVITVETQRASDGQCTASAEMTIAGVPARVASVYVQQRLFGIAYVLVTGWSEAGSLVRERLSL